MCFLTKKKHRPGLASPLLLFTRNSATIRIMMDAYQILWCFLIYSVIGWVIEVIYHAVTMGKIINRGFLNGPVCPVYGVGMLCVLTLAGMLRPDDATGLSAPVLFLGGMFLASAVELVAGWLLDRLFHTRWWDYSNVPFNFHGYICLKFSVLWGIGNVYVMKLVHPVVALLISMMLPCNYGWGILAISYLFFAADVIVTVLIVRGMNQKLELLDDLQHSLRIVSDRMSEQIGENALEAAMLIDESRVQATLAKAELRDLAEKTKGESLEMLAHRKASLYASAEEIRRTLMQTRIFGARRLLRAFPGLQSEKYAEIIAQLKELLS